MTLSVNHNLSALQAARDVRQTSVEQAVLQGRLASGERIQRASQAPSELVLSERMRSHRGAIEYALRNAQTSASMLQTAEASLAEVNSMLVDLRGLAVQAANEAIHDEITLSLLHAEATNLLDSIDRVAESTNFGSRSLLAGKHAASGSVAGDGVAFISATDQTRQSPAGGYEVQITQAPKQAYMQGQRPIELSDLVYPDGSLRKDFRITIEEQGRSAEFGLNNPSDAIYIERLVEGVKAGVKAGASSLSNQEETNQQLRSLIRGNLNKRLEGRGMQVRVSLEDGSTQKGPLLTIRHVEYGSKPSFKALSNAPNTLSQDTSAFSVAVLGADVQGRIDGLHAFGKGTILQAAPQGDAQGVILEVDPEVIENEGGEHTVVAHVSQDSLHFQVGPRENNIRRISLPNVNTRNLGKDAAKQHGYTSLRDIDLTTTPGASAAMAILDEAIQNVTATRVNLGGLQEHALESASRSMRIWREQVIAADSYLRDTDMAKEASDLALANIKLQSGITVLTKANQSPSAILQLLGGS